MPTPAAKGLRRASKSGAALPHVPVLQKLHAGRVNLRRGQLVMVAAIPNAGKSALAEWYASQVGVPTLYISADQDEWTTMTRLASSITNTESHVIAEAIGTGQDAPYREALASSLVAFCFDSNPSVEDIWEELDAWVEIHDDWPALIVVDNLVNIEGSGELQADQWIISELHGMARITRACVMVLVHASEASVRDHAWPPTRKDILNKLSKFPELVLTVANDPATNEFKVAVVKSRETKADPTAEHPYILGVDFERMQFMPSPPSRYTYRTYSYDNEENDW